MGEVELRSCLVTYSDHVSESEREMMDLPELLPRSGRVFPCPLPLHVFLPGKKIKLQLLRPRGWALCMPVINVEAGTGPCGPHSGLWSLDSSREASGQDRAQGSLSGGEGGLSLLQTELTLLSI